MNNFAAIASLLAASAFAGSVNADKTPSARTKTDQAPARK
jgi:hypothetical protein